MISMRGSPNTMLTNLRCSITALGGDLKPRRKGDYTVHRPEHKNAATGTADLDADAHVGDVGWASGHHTSI